MATFEQLARAAKEKERERAYWAAMGVVMWIDEDLAGRRRHFRDAETGRLVVTLDEAMRALGRGHLVVGGAGVRDGE